MKKFFLSIYLVLIVISTLNLVLAWSETRGECSFLIAPSGIEIVILPEGRELLFQELQFNDKVDQIDYKLIENEKYMRPIGIKAKWAPFIGVWFSDEVYVTAPVTRNGSFIVLSFTALSNIVLVGWVLLIIKYREEITLGWGKFISLFKRKGKDLEQKQV
jgi:hypothetical protein